MACLTTGLAATGSHPRVRCLIAPFADFPIEEIARSPFDNRFGAGCGWPYLRVEHSGSNIRREASTCAKIGARLTSKFFQLSDTAPYLTAFLYQCRYNEPLIRT
jgi:hypothetical protein